MDEKEPELVPMSDIRDTLLAISLGLNVVLLASVATTLFMLLF